MPQRRSPAAWSAPGWTASCCDTLQTCAREKYSFIGALVYVFTLSMDLPTRVHSLRRHSTSRSAGLSVLLLASSTIRHSCKVLIAGPCFAGRARRRSRCGRACAAWPPGTAAPLPGGGEAHLSRVLMCFPPHVPTAMPCPHVVYTGGSAAGTRSAASAASASTGGTCYSCNLGETETVETQSAAAAASVSTEAVSRPLQGVRRGVL